MHTMCLCVRYLHAVAHAVQQLVVDWSAAVRWAGLCTGRLRWRKDLVAARNSSHRREGSNFSPRNFLFVHLHGLRRVTSTVSSFGLKLSFTAQICSPRPIRPKHQTPHSLFSHHSFWVHSKKLTFKHGLFTVISQ